MRISSRVAVLAFAGAVLAGPALTIPAFAFDGTAVPDATAPVVPGVTGSASANAAAAAQGSVTTVAAPMAPGAAAPIPPKAIPNATTLSALQYAAEGGHPVAQFKLGQMYATGEGVAQSDMRAFQYFSSIANAHAEDSPSAPQAKIVASAFVSLGQYYLTGIPNSRVTADPERAREMFAYAASYFGHAEAQYQLGRLYLNAPKPQRDVRSGSRWLEQAAKKGQHQAQGMLGQMLFNGDQVPKQAAKGLMYLSLAVENAGAQDGWIKDAYSKALAKASEDDRAMAGQMLSSWVKGRRD